MIAEEFHFPKPAFGSMEETLDFLFWKACQEKMIFVRDEYSYLRDCVTGMDSILQALIDKYRDRSAFQLILCGSFVDVMESLLYHENPLYGRVDLTVTIPERVNVGKAKLRNRRGAIEENQEEDTCIY